MNKTAWDRFDIVMANLKPVETSVAFELEFRKRLAEAASRKDGRTPVENIARRALSGLERLREALIPRTLVPVRVMAAFLFFISAGLYVYSIQPASPAATGVEGIVMVQARGASGESAIPPHYALKEGDTISTKSGSQVDIGLTDRYAIRVKPGTTLRVAKLAPRLGRGTVDLRLSDGNMLIDIEKGFKGSKFLVTTEAGTAKALGTKFIVSSSRRGKARMDVDVLEGRVVVESSYRPADMLIAKQTVIVGPGQKTEVTEGRIPAPPQRLIESEWRRLEELYQIGRKPQVMLLLKNTPDRVRQLLEPCPIYISDEKPRELPADLEDVVKRIGEAIDTGDTSKHLESVRILEKIVRDNPNAKYNPQLLLYIGSYYEYLGRHQDAIRLFREALRRYPESQFSGIAQCAIGIIYDEELKDPGMAGEAFRAVLKHYPDSLEAIWVEEKLGIKKDS